MRKGEIKKQEILETAETMFCKNGYETTSVQDIIDVLHTSKGSFYHHYASKEMLLEAICRRRAGEISLAVSSRLSEKASALDNLNILFSGFIPLSGEKLTFLLMILPVFNLPEGRQIRYGYCESLTGSFLPDVTGQLISGTMNGELYCPDADHSARTVLLLLNDLWCRICAIMISGLENGKETDLSELLKMIESYRTSVEKVLTAPFGSFELMNLNDLKLLYGQIAQHWNQK